MPRILTYNDINREEWSALVQTSATATWFQTPEAYDFFASQPDLFTSFVVGVASYIPSLQGGELPELGSSNGRSSGQRRSNQTLGGRLILRALCAGYVTLELNPLKQFFTRRAIILGGPCLADDATDEEVSALMNAVRDHLSFAHSLTRSFVHSPIYIETRNFNDYSQWRTAFESAGFEYQPHLNFHINTSSVEIVEANLGKSRKRDIKTTIRDGVTINEHPTSEQIHEYYLILKNLYTTKVKTPLFPESFFQALAKHPDGRLLLTMYNNRVIGGTVCVEWAGKCVYEWFVCGVDGVYPHIFPSCYATYAGIRYTAEHDCPRFDMMGAGTPDEAYGVRDFKAKFGGTEVEHGRYLCITKPLLYEFGKLGVKLLKKLK